MIEDPGMNPYDDEPGYMSGDYHNKCPKCKPSNDKDHPCDFCGGATIVGFKWHVETEWADCHWVMCYVGGEDPEFCHDSFPTHVQALECANYLNTREGNINA